MSNASQLEAHPSVIRFRRAAPRPQRQAVLDASALKQLAIACGAADCGLVEVTRPALATELPHVLECLPGTKTLLAFVCRMAPDAIRAPVRSVANLEFHHSGDEAGEVGRRIVKRLNELGVRATTPPIGFPMEMDRYPGRIWVVAHKPVAVAAGLGRMGVHRNVIHPRFGNFILLGTVLLDREASSYDAPLEFNPCLECNLCVAACPVGAIHANGDFDFGACANHNYQEFMGGTGNWIETIADSGSAAEYRRRVTDSEAASRWQSLSFGANYKAAYCLAVCPAGDEVIAPFLLNRKKWLSDVVKPLQQRAEPVYVVPGSDAEAHVVRRFPHKHVRRVRSGLRPTSIDSFLFGAALTFQRRPARELEAIYHFEFIGLEPRTATITIGDGKLEVAEGRVGTADLSITADSATWLRFLRRDANIVWALLTRKVRLERGPARAGNRPASAVGLLKAFGRCFPS